MRQLWWVWPKNQVTVISVEEPIIFRAHKKGTFAQMQWACSLVFWILRGCTLWICSTRTDCKQYYYIDTLQWLREVFGKNDLKIGIRWLVSWSWKCMGSALSVLEFLPRNKVMVIWHPPYLPDLALCDFFVFSELLGIVTGKDI